MDEREGERESKEEREREKQRFSKKFNFSNFTFSNKNLVHSGLCEIIFENLWECVRMFENV